MSSGRVGKAIVLAVMAGTGNWGWIFAWPVTASTGVNGLIFYEFSKFVKLAFLTVDCEQFLFNPKICGKQHKKVSMRA